ncbi:DNA mismatch repair endonuclease MutL [Clostridium botulinum]|uniref:DNA mismatch repair endonuclease MutL n=1 Tax=Clostridium botulinum TaxID=1491 RepID=UPI0007E25EB6|nr:DNA mismatch repair endonuclease MutL [Clostridium botulinum]KEI81024.1 DNA mismatch repair protein MutL [Clostridium botulinum B2 331]NFA92330.1 DNA mismatch repair endonuclease MutL [Clostridium botulinum]NFI40702.1 DNA mismatch repair endonuclease MutL [Clostridium botulinum]NFT58849.1 DNA mismatch repair endonuclease MutL [Clostridium botulinum]
MRKINLLDLETTNKIAAGEVIERPFSVVKELVENSIDAGAKNITIEIEDGGQKLIKIIDDGEGIYPIDIKNAFLPHATSKINSIEDIYKISTMGFRGEALASISSVSKTKLKSRVDSYNFGKEIYIEGGKIEYLKDTGCNVGTTIEVSNLFYNVPARLKFLKSARNDSSAISDIVNRFILAHPDISFNLINKGKQSIKSYGTGNLKDSIRCVYNKTISENLINFESHKDIISVYGFIGKPEISRKSRTNQSIFVNKRYVKSKFITAAVENAFKSFLTVNSYPFFVIFIDIFPEYIDVNVHPTKSEVKFKDERAMFKTIFDAVHEAIKGELKESFTNFFNKEDINMYDSEKSIAETIKPGKEEVQIPIDLNSNNKIDIFGNNINKLPNNAELLKNIGIKEKNTLENNNNFYTSKQNEICYTNKNDECLNSCNKDDYSKIEKPLQKDNKNLDTLYLNEHNTNSSPINIKENKPNNFYVDMKIIGQFNNTYILIEKDKELYIIDQHAAHEKVLFEKFKSEIEKGYVISQILLSPVVIELSEDEFNIYEENKDIFKNSGFSVETFGECTINIKEVPLILGKPNVEDLFMDILYNLKNMKSKETSTIKYNAIATLACKSAVKANDNLKEEEIKKLIENMLTLNNPYTCPHGRPTMIKFTLKDLEKKFKRIQ